MKLREWLIHKLGGYTKEDVAKIDIPSFYPINFFGKQLNNLMKCLIKQQEDNKAILFFGLNDIKVIITYKEYQKMCQALFEKRGDK